MYVRASNMLSYKKNPCTWDHFKKWKEMAMVFPFIRHNLFHFLNFRLYTFICTARNCEHIVHITLLHPKRIQHGGYMFLTIFKKQMFFLATLLNWRQENHVHKKYSKKQWYVGCCNLCINLILQVKKTCHSDCIYY